jgi:hypothetical protein
VWLNFDEDVLLIRGNSDLCMLLVCQWTSKGTFGLCFFTILMMHDHGGPSLTRAVFIHSASRRSPYPSSEHLARVTWAYFERITSP